MSPTMSYVDEFEEYCDCGARMASDGACENEDHEDGPSGGDS